MSTDPYAGPPPDPNYGRPNYDQTNYGRPPYPADPAYGVPPYDPGDVSSKKLLAGICGILLGTFGVHKFILGYTNAGAIMLAVSLASIVGTVVTCGVTAPVTAVMGVIGLVEGIIYLTKTDEDFYRTYIAGKKEWF